MKKIIDLIVALLWLFATSGCETEKILFHGPYFVRFTETALTHKESFSKPVFIEVHNGGPALDEDITITFKLSGSARKDIDYTIVGSQENVVIKKGEYFGNIQVLLINNSNNILRSQDLVITLQSVNTSKRRVGQGESAIGKSFTYNIIDDCVLGGDYIGDRNGFQANDVTITSSDCENYTLSNWNIGVFTTSAVMDLKFIDNGDNTLTIPQQEEEKISSDLATIVGIGTVDPVSRKITMTITLVDYNGQPKVTISYIPD